MRPVHIISTENDGASMVHTLNLQGADVSLFNVDESADSGVRGFGIKRFSKSKQDLENYIDKHRNDLFVFDDSEKGSLQDKKRKEGIDIIGSSNFFGKIERERYFGHEVAQSLGVRVPKTIIMESVKDAIKYIEENPKRYILKQTGNMPKTLNWSSYFDDSRDMILHLITMREKFGDKLNGKMVLQEFVEVGETGGEVALSCIFNGKDWVRMNGEVVCFVNWENKKLLEGNKGVSVGETGTICKYVLGENRVFKEMLKPLEKKLREENYIGVIDANCMLSEDDKIYLVEWTPRWGYPCIDCMLSELNNMNLYDFFEAIVQGKEINVDIENYAMVLLLAFPLYPYEKTHADQDSFKGEVVWLDNLSEEEHNHLHLYECNLRDFGKYGKQLVVSNSFGYGMTITGKGDIKTANKKALEIIEKIVPSKAGFFRGDLEKINRKRIENTKGIVGL